MLFRPNCFSFVCRRSILARARIHTSAGQIFHRSFHRSAMKISFVCRQFSLNPQTPLERIRQSYVLCEDQPNIFVPNYRVSRYFVWRDRNNLKYPAKGCKLFIEDADGTGLMGGLLLNLILPNKYSLSLIATHY